MASLISCEANNTNNKAYTAEDKDSKTTINQLEKIAPANFPNPDDYHDYASIKNVKKIPPDTYPVTEDMLKNNKKKLIHRKIETSDQTWFTNKDLNQSLIIGIYTDYYLPYLIHFDNNHIGFALDYLPLYHRSNDDMLSPASLSMREKAIKPLLKQARHIEEKYFTSVKGVKLGHSFEKVCDILGQPDSTTNHPNTQTSYWKNRGDQIPQDIPKNYKKAIIKDSFDHEVICMFYHNKLATHIILNQVP